MVERFVTFAGTISIDTGDSTVVGTDTLFRGRDREGAQLWAQPPDAEPFRIGTVAAVEPRGIYENLSLPLLHPWSGDPVVDLPFELIDSVAMANSATLAAVYARFTSDLENNFGLVGNLADTLTDEGWQRVFNNSLFVDAVTRTIYQWRHGVLEPVKVIGDGFTPRGAWALPTTFAKNDLVQHGNAIFVSNADGNVGHEPVTSPPASNAYWTWMPLGGAGERYVDVLVNVQGQLGDGEEFGAFIAAGTMVFPAGLVGSVSLAAAAATSEAVVSLKKNGVAWATLTWAATGIEPVFVSAAGVTLTAGDVVTCVGPDPADPTLRDIRLTLRGTMDVASPVNQRGVATVDFGSSPGATDASVIVTGQGKIAADSLAEAWIWPGEGTDDHSVDEHVAAGLQFAVIDIVPGVGFTIRAVSPNGAMVGTFNAAWRWD